MENANRTYFDEGKDAELPSNGQPNKADLEGTEAYIRNIMNSDKNNCLLRTEKCLVPFNNYNGPQTEIKS